MDILVLIFVDSDPQYSSKNPGLAPPMSKEEKRLIITELFHYQLHDIKRGQISSTINKIIENKDKMEPNIREYYSSRDSNQTYQRVYQYIHRIIQSVRETSEVTSDIMPNESDPDVRNLLKKLVMKNLESEKKRKNYWKKFMTGK